MKRSIIVKIIFNIAVVVVLEFFVGGAVFIKIFKGLLAKSEIPADLADKIVGQSITVFTAVLAVLILIIVAGIYFELKKTIIKPLEKFHKGAEVVAMGNLDYKIREGAGLQPEDEIDQLAQSFDEMSEKLKESYSGLERKVKERTEEVVKKVNDLKKMKTALYNILDDVNKEKDKIEIIISSIGEGLIVIDIDYKIKMINPVAEKLLEVKASDVIDQDAKKFIFMYKGDKPLQDEERPVAKMLKTMGTVIFSGLADNLYYQTLSGKRFPIDIIVSPLKNGAEITGAVVVFRDISELKKLDEAKTSFISIASHQLRTPLTSIRWYAEMLENGDAGKLNDQQKDFISRVYGGAMKLNEVINLLLALARIESGKSEQELTRVNLIDFVKDAINGLEPLLKAKNLKTDLVCEKPLEAKIDASKLRQVVVNLLSNSIRYTDNNGTIEAKIEEKERDGEKGGKEIVFSVKDDGIGIPEKQKEKIFMKFFRAENAVSKVPDGSGLGLALVKALVESWGGKTWFESPAQWGKEKKGTAFYFTIPTNYE